MVSRVMLLANAVSIAARSLGLAAGSLPLSRAAAVISRISFVISLPRLVSCLPLRCWILAHLLCPAMVTFKVNNVIAVSLTFALVGPKRRLPGYGLWLRQCPPWDKRLDHNRTSSSR